MIFRLEAAAYQRLDAVIARSRDSGAGIEQLRADQKTR